MTKHFQYLNYVLRHKYYVFIEGLKLNVPILQLILHDWDKFLPDEWFAYVNTFYGRTDLEKVGSKEFDIAWNNHQKRNKHHWERYCLVCYGGLTVALPMDYNDIIEMLADWSGASMAKKGKNDIVSWYERIKDDIFLHPDTRFIVERIIKEQYKDK